MADTTDHDPKGTLEHRVRRARVSLGAELDVMPPAFGEVRQRARRRHQRLAGALLIATVVGGSVLVLNRTQDEVAIIAGPREVGQPSDANEDLLPAGGTRPLPPSPLSPRSTMATVWTGEEMLIWGGDGTEGPFDDGAAYDPRSDEWRMMSEGPLSARNAPAAVWTGAEMVLWGGHAFDGDHSDGAAYDPSTDTWRSIAEAPMVSEGLPTAVWTGSEMIVLSGINGRSAAAYDPADDEWRSLVSSPGQPWSIESPAVWTGTHVVAQLAYPGGVRTGLFSYDPDADRWTELPGFGEDGNRLTTLAWAGDRLLAVPHRAGAPAATYDFESGEWTGVATLPSGAPAATAAVWTGDRLLLWAGDEALVLDPFRGTWTDTPAGGVPRRVQAATVWADGVFIAWGGFQDRSDGVMLRPAAVVAGASGETVPLLPDSGYEQDLVPVAGADGTTPGTIDRNGPPATWNNQTLPLLPVEDDDGNLVGYFGCRFLERSEVERDDFEPDGACVTPTTSTDR